MPDSNNKILNLADLNNKAKFKNIFTSDETEYTPLFKSNNPDVDAPLLWPNNWGETSPLNLIWLLFNTDNDTSFGICFHIDGEETNAPGSSFLSAMDSAVFNTIKNSRLEGLFDISSSDKLNAEDINYRFGKNATLQLFPNATVNSSYTRSGKDYWFRLCLHDWNWEQLTDKNTKDSIIEYYGLRILYYVEKKNGNWNFTEIFNRPDSQTNEIGWETETDAYGNIIHAGWIDSYFTTEDFYWFSEHENSNESILSGKTEEYCPTKKEIVKNEYSKELIVENKNFANLEDINVLIYEDICSTSYTFKNTSLYNCLYPQNSTHIATVNPQYPNYTYGSDEDADIIYGLDVDNTDQQQFEGGDGHSSVGGTTGNGGITPDQPVSHVPNKFIVGYIISLKDLISIIDGYYQSTANYAKPAEPSGDNRGYYFWDPKWNDVGDYWWNHSDPETPYMPLNKYFHSAWNWENANHPEQSLKYHLNNIYKDYFNTFINTISINNITYWNNSTNKWNIPYPDSSYYLDEGKTVDSSGNNIGTYDPNKYADNQLVRLSDIKTFPVINTGSGSGGGNETQYPTTVNITHEFLLHPLYFNKSIDYNCEIPGSATGSIEFDLVLTTTGNRKINIKNNGNFFVWRDNLTLQPVQANSLYWPNIYLDNTPVMLFENSGTNFNPAINQSAVTNNGHPDLKYRTGDDNEFSGEFKSIPSISNNSPSGPAPFGVPINNINYCDIQFKWSNRYTITNLGNAKITLDDVKISNASSSNNYTTIENDGGSDTYNILHRISNKQLINNGKILNITIQTTIDIKDLKEQLHGK